MAIFVGSRYEFEQLYYVERSLAVLPPKPRPRTFDYVRYLSREGDRLDQLAQRFLGNPRLWTFLAEANPEIPYPEDIPPGTELRIPRVPSVL